MAKACFDDPGFLAALREMQALGLQVTATPHAGSIAMDVLAGRMRLRWYMVPPRPRAVRVASLALIQPLRTGPRMFKRVATGAARLGVPYPWRHARVYASGVNRIAAAFGPNTTHAAFLTGTAGPHRKLTVQFMDARGGIRGYAKVASTPATQALLANEAATLAELHDAGLRTAVLPRVLLQEHQDGAAVLATDTVRTQRSACHTRLQAPHLAFLDELAARTASARVPDGEALLHRLRAKTHSLPASLPAEWRLRLERSLQALAIAPELIAPRGLAHGDFTPGNTFQYRERLCVFDWEYAGYDYPADYDLVRFMFAAQSSRRGHVVDHGQAVESVLIHDLQRAPRSARARVLAYLCVQALLLAGRQPERNGQALTWEGEPAMARMLDALNERGPIPS
ncbi:MAG: phosphotransferase family protein [Rhodanobacteraceae bacterium]